MDDLNNITLSLGELLSDDDFKSELKAFRCAFQRLRVRLRNNLFIAQLKQLASMNRQLVSQFSCQIFTSYLKRIQHPVGKRQRIGLKSLLHLICQLISFLDIVIDKTMFIYCSTQPHFRVGHLVHHFIAVRTCVARLRVCFKALLIYASDLHSEILMYSKQSDSSKELKSSNLISSEQVIGILQKHNCKPRCKRECSVEIIEQDLGARDDLNSNPMIIEEVGQLIDRETMKICMSPAESSRPKKKIRAQ